MDQLYFSSTSIVAAGRDDIGRGSSRDDRRSSPTSRRGDDGGGGLSIDELRASSIRPP